MMLDRGINLRLMLAWYALAGSIGAGIAAWLLEIEALGRLGTLLALAACTLFVLHDNAKTRRAVWRTAHPAPTGSVRSIH